MSRPFVVGFPHTFVRVNLRRSLHGPFASTTFRHTGGGFDLRLQDITRGRSGTDWLEKKKRAGVLLLVVTRVFSGTSSEVDVSVATGQLLLESVNLRTKRSRWRTTADCVF